MAWQTRLSELLLPYVRRACCARRGEVWHASASCFLHGLACALQLLPLQNILPLKLLSARDKVKAGAG